MALIPSRAITEDHRAEMRRLYREFPEVRRKIASMPFKARQSVTETLAQQAIFVEAMATELEILGEELGTMDARPAVRILASHVVTCWIKLQAAEEWAARLTKGSHVPSEGDYVTRMENSAQKRFLQAIELLERVKRAGNGPSVIFNVAEKQVNVCSG